MTTALQIAKQHALDDFKQNLEDRVAFLQEHMASLYDKGDRSFCANLCDFYEHKGYLTGRQLVYMVRYYEEVGGKIEAEEDEDREQQHPAREAVFDPPRVVVNGLPIVTLFDTAAKFIQKPKIVYKLAPPIHGCTNLVFYRTGEHSHAPGSVGVVNGALAPDNSMLATVYRDKPAVFYRGAFGKPELQQVIKLLCEKPMEHLQHNGKAHGVCCYCARPLTDPRSVTAGYGPVCADHWGLPWGDELPQVRLDGI